jgi:hypothetical protein
MRITLGRRGLGLVDPSRHHFQIEQFVERNRGISHEFLYAKSQQCKLWRLPPETAAATTWKLIDNPVNSFTCHPVLAGLGLQLTN